MLRYCMIFTLLTFATGDLFARNFHFFMTRKQSVGPGTVYYSGHSKDPKWKVFVTEIDMNNPHIEIVPSTPPADKGIRAIPTFTAAGVHAMVTVNSSFFSMDSGIPYGYFRKEGTTVRPNPDTPFGTMGFTWGPKPKAVVANVNQAENSVNEDVPYTVDNVSDAVAGGPVLMVNGQIRISPEYKELAKRNPRTAMGYNKESAKLYIAVIDGRSSDSVGMTFEETAQFMQDLGCTDAVNYDGGGSSAMVVNGKVVNSPSGKTQRPVPVCWSVINSTVIDDSNSSLFSATGDWTADPNTTTGLYKHQALYVTGGKPALATYETNLPEAGYYEIYARWNSGDKRASDAVHYTIETPGAKLTVVKDQTQSKGEWQSLGQYRFRKAFKARVIVSNKGVSADQYVCADACRFVYLGETEPQTK